MRCVALVIAALTVIRVGHGHVALAQAPSTQARAPRLVVILTVDQMRADFVDRFSPDWKGGLKRLVTDGAWFPEAAYSYLPTWTCVGHATIGTGTQPRH